MSRQWMHCLCAPVLWLSPPSTQAQCWSEAAQRFSIPAALLYAVAKVESNLNPRAINRSHLRRTDSYDIGLMQINSSHLPALARQGIRETDLYSPCTNLLIGAQLLADLFKRYGRTWNAVGAYNASCTQLRGQACIQARTRYAWKVYRQLQRMRGQRSPMLVAAQRTILNRIRITP
jgi:soluble lytic murein transglycosylase-like protein